MAILHREQVNLIAWASEKLLEIGFVELDDAAPSCEDSTWYLDLVMWWTRLPRTVDYNVSPVGMHQGLRGGVVTISDSSLLTVNIHH